MIFLGGTLYSDEVDRFIRYSVFVFTPLAVLFSLLTMLGFFNDGAYGYSALGVAVLAAWSLQALYIYFSRNLPRRSVAINLVAYHVFALANTILITGFSNPTTSVLALLLVISFLYFRFAGAYLSAFLITMTAFLAVLLEPSALASVIATLISTLFVGGAAIGFALTQEKRLKLLEKSQGRERLQHEQMTTIINNLTDATFTVNERGSVLMYNAASLDILDTNSSIRGKSIDKLFNLTYDNKEPVGLMDILKQTTRANTRDDLVHVYKNGDKINIELTYAPISSPYSKTKRGASQSGYILIARDVTKRKNLDEEKDEFISVVSHELRTPIAIAEGTLSNLEVLLNRTEKTDKKVLSSTVSTAHEQIMYLAKMINDLSTLSRAERGTGDEQELIDVRELLHTMHGRYEGEALAKKLRLDLDLGNSLGQVMTSRLYIEELLQNLITNAIKYTDEGSVTIIAKKLKNAITFTIKDTGIGISKADQDKIFGKFYRSEDYRTRETGGTGLGLYVSSKLAMKLNTKIILTSRLNYGSSFSFELESSKVDPSR